jgi:beta-xylosidase
MKYIVKLACCLCFIYHNLNGQNIKPAIPGDFADPSVIRAGDRYYAVGTSSEWAPHFPIFTSTDLKSWKQTGYLFNKAPEWTSSSFWAPEYFYHNNTYFIYYTARRKTDYVSCIGVATSRYPDRDFTDHGIIIEYGKEAIDAFVFNDNGQLYISWKAYGLDKRPIEILGSKLSADGLKLEGEPFSLMKDTDRIGLEGQSILKKDGYYYLFYSAGNCCGRECNYNVRIARSASIQGPYENYGGNPALQENDEWKCSGHGTFVTAPDGTCYYLYHAYNKSSTVFTGRQGMLAELTWPGTKAWPVFRELSGSAGSINIKDDFEAKTPANYWQWDFRNSTPVVKQSGGKLYLSGSVQPENITGLVLTVRPASQHYEMQATVVNQNNAVKGLAVYGDANAAIGVGISGGNVEYWMVKDDKRTVLASLPVNKTAPVELKMNVNDGIGVSFRQGAQWQALIPSTPVSVDFLPPWDRSPRIGLHFNGAPGEEAVFSKFEVIYLTSK